MGHFAVSALGADRPGIVAAVTEVLTEQGCNLEDSTMAILRGHFAMMLIVAAPEEASTGALEAALGPAAARFELVLVVRPIDEAVPAVAAGEPWTVTVYGADRPGIVHGVASVLAEQGVNITDLNTRVIGEPEHPAYAMVMDVTVPAGADTAKLWDQLRARARELGVDSTVHPAEADIL